MPTFHQNLEKNCSKLQALQNISWNDQNLTFLTLHDLIIWPIQKLQPVEKWQELCYGVDEASAAAAASAGANRAESTFSGYN